jgi:hypothetical protein
MGDMLMNVRCAAGAFVVLLGIAASSNAAVILDDFTSTTLDPMWTLDDSPGSYAGGGGFSLDGSYARFNTILANGYGHLQTPVNTSGTARVDAIMRQDNYAGEDRWGIGSGFYFDADNWASMKLNSVGSVFGWVVTAMVGGTLTEIPMMTGSVGNRADFQIGGVELTATEVKFWGSNVPPIPPGKYETNGVGVFIGIDPTVKHTIPRPASFGASGLAIIGKGFTGAGATNPDFDNIGPAGGEAAFVGINVVRITTNPIPEPMSLGLLVIGLGSMLMARGSRK